MPRRKAQGSQPSASPTTSSKSVAQSSSWFDRKRRQYALRDVDTNKYQFIVTLDVNTTIPSAFVLASTISHGVDAEAVLDRSL